MRGESERDITRGSSIINALSELEPRTVEALVDVLTRLAQLLESEYQESLSQCYEEAAQHAARDQLSLDLFDDSDITFSGTDKLPF